jgi:two-component system C4-dicarboxylate transport response regulator DctD
MSGSPSVGSTTSGSAETRVGARVLVVEDFDGLRELMVKVLTLEGYDVVGAATASSAAALCTTEHFDLLVTDCRLPGGNGNEIARLAVDHNPDLEVLFVSGSRESAVDIEVPGVSPRFLEKPVNIDDLCLNVRQLLG